MYISNKSGPNEAINITEEYILEDSSWVSPDSVDSVEINNNKDEEDLFKEDVVMTETVFSKRSSRIREFEKISSRHGFPIEIKKVADARAVSLTKSVGSRVLFNVIVNAGNVSAEIAGNITSIFNSSYSDKDVFEAIDSLYTSVKKANHNNNGGKILTMPKKFLDYSPSADKSYKSTDALVGDFVSHGQLTLNGQKYHIKDIDRIHAVLYGFIKAEQKHNLGIFAPQQGNKAFQYIAALRSVIGEKIQNLETSIINNAKNIHPLTLLIYLAFPQSKYINFQTRMISNFMNKIQGVFPAATSKNAIISFFGVASFAEAYDYIITEDMPTSSSDYFLDSEVLQVTVGDVLSDLVGNIMGNIASFGEIAGKIVSSVFTGGKEFARNFKRSMSKDKKIISSDIANFWDNSTVIDVSRAYPLEETGEKHYAYIGDLDVLEQNMQSQSFNYFNQIREGQMIVQKTVREDDLNTEMEKAMGIIYKRIDKNKLDTQEAEIRFSNESIGKISFTGKKINITERNVEFSYDNGKFAPIISKTPTNMGNRTGKPGDDFRYDLESKHLSFVGEGFEIEDGQKVIVCDEGGNYNGGYSFYYKEGDVLILAKDTSKIFPGSPEIDDMYSASIMAQVVISRMLKSKGVRDFDANSPSYKVLTEDLIALLKSKGLDLYEGVNSANVYIVLYLLSEIKNQYSDRETRKFDNAARKIEKQRAKDKKREDKATRKKNRKDF